MKEIATCKEFGHMRKQELCRYCQQESHDVWKRCWSDSFHYSGSSEKAESDPDTITLKRIYSTHCQVCGESFTKDCWNKPVKHKIVYFVPLDNNITCFSCARDSGYPYEPRIYKEGE